MVRRLTFTCLPGPGLRVPYSLGWTLQLDRELVRGVLVRIGYESRSGHHDFYVNPLQAAKAAPSCNC